MKKWTKPEIVTLYEEELKNIIVAGACSLFEYCPAYFCPEKLSGVK